MGEWDIVNWFGIRTDDSGELVIKLNVISFNYDRKRANIQRHDDIHRERRFELRNVINKERLKMQRRKKATKVEGKLDEQSDEEADPLLSDESDDQHYVRGADGRAMPSYQNVS